MGLSDIFKRNTREQPQVEPKQLEQVDDVLLRSLLTGETITREKALTLPAVSSAVDFISNTIASMPVRLYRTKKGSVSEVENDTRVKMLNGDTHDTLDGFQLKKALIEDYLLGKGGYCYIQRQRNDVTGLFYVQERNIQINLNTDPVFKKYVINVQGKNYQPYEFIKLLRNTKDGASGTGLTVEVAKTLETAYQTLLYQLMLVRSGGNKKGFIKSQSRLGTEEINALKRAWSNLYSNNEENAVVLNKGLEFQEASSSSVEMQLNESKRTLHEELNGLFHIHDDFMQTFKEGIYPIVRAFETALNRDLLLENEKKTHYFKFDVAEIVKASLQERYAAYEVAKKTGFMTINEIRRAENMNAIQGMDVINVGLASVLYNTETTEYFTPNTGQFVDVSENGGSENDVSEDNTELTEGGVENAD